jgi:hypothetical protein
MKRLLEKKMELSKDGSHEASIRMARNFDIQSKYILAQDGRTFFELVKHVVDECNSNLKVNSWVHLSNENARHWIGSFLMAVAIEITKASDINIEVTTAKLAVYFSISNSNFFNTDNPNDDLNIVLNLPTYQGDSSEMFIESTLMVGRDIRNWIGNYFSGEFPTQQLNFLIDLYEKNAIPTALNNSGKEEFENLMNRLTEGYIPIDEANKIESSNSSGLNNSENIEACSRIAQIYEYLKSEGLSPVVDSPTSLLVKYEDRTYWVEVFEDDEQYYSIVVPNFWEIDNILSLLDAYKACSTISCKSKVAKAHINENSDNVWIRVSTYHETIDEFNAVVLRYLKAAKYARQHFRETMLKLEDERNSGPQFTEEDIENLEELECVTLFALSNDNKKVANTKCFYSRLKDEFSDFEQADFLEKYGIDKLTFRTKLDGEIVDAYLVSGVNGAILKLCPF